MGVQGPGEGGRDEIRHKAPSPVPSRLLVLVLSLTLLVSWGSLYYGFAILVRPLQAELNWTPASAMGAFSLALVVWGICTYPVGRWVDRFGGRWAMTVGSCMCAILFAALTRTQSLSAFYLVWTGLGVSMALTLYEPAFAVLIQAWPAAFRRPVGILTLVGGLASTVFWPLTQFLVTTLGWRTTLLIYAAMHLFVCAPLHALVVPAALPRRSQSAEAAHHTPAREGPSNRLPWDSRPFWLLMFAFGAFGFVTSLMATHIVPMLESTGKAPASAIAIAALIGPMQVAGRSAELLLAGRLGSRFVGLGTVLLISGALVVLLVCSSSPYGLCLFAAAYGAGLGLLTIVRATAPVEVFGPARYAAISGALSTPSTLARGAGPLLGTYLLTAWGGYDAVLLMLVVVSLAGAAAYALATRRT